MRNIGHEFSIILVAHRLSTVKACDTIFLLNKERLEARGTLGDLAQVNERFRAMAAKEIEIA